MEKVRKTFFEPLENSKERIKEILQDLPVGSAHPFSPEQILLCRSQDGVTEIDISSYPEDFFFNAVDLGEMGEVLLNRMTKFHHLNIFKDFQIMQAPDTTFKIPMVSNEITILAVSQKYPTYWDFCFADEFCNTCCWTAKKTISGISHSGDIVLGSDLLHFVRIDEDSFTEKEISVFISGYQKTHISRFVKTHPALLVADHADKILYIIPVPMDAATIGKATICCPLVIKREDNFLVCSILPTATTDEDTCCEGRKLESPAFPEAIERADFTITRNSTTKQREHYADSVRGNSKRRKLTGTDTISHSLGEKKDTSSNDTRNVKVMSHQHAIFATYSANIPSCFDHKETQIVRFGTGLEFEHPTANSSPPAESSNVVLPCIFGSKLQGPVLLATGTVPSNVPFTNQSSLLEYYKQLKSAVVVVDDKMSDNARNLASDYRINALFIVQLTPETEPKDSDVVLDLLNSSNVNAVTALAGPQSLVLVQAFDQYYFYRGIANRAHLDTSGLEFGANLTSLLRTADMQSIIDPRVSRIVRLNDSNGVLLPKTGQFVQPQALRKVVDELSIEAIEGLESEIAAAVPQLQVLLNQKELQELSNSLIAAISAKVSKATAPLREKYTRFLESEYKVGDKVSNLIKGSLLGDLKKTTKDLQKAIEPMISCLSNIVSAQTTSKRTHDLKRLVRQTTIQNNVEAVKSMTFESMSRYLEEYAGDMGVLLVNIETESFKEMLGSLKNDSLDASQCCALDSRVLHLDGFDAGIIIEQSQSKHNGPLESAAGLNQPILALPYLSQLSGTGSMLAWVCWDEFVNLKSPYKTRWMEKCNEPHIAALRIVMRNTLSQAVASRECNLDPSSPETGKLMTSLLMAAMSKLAVMRTSHPEEIDGVAEDTVTRLMRGLLGNLLTIAGSGVRPMSMVWQLFGLHPQYDVPNTAGEWAWYEAVVKLYPYTGWHLPQFLMNLEKLLDKVVIRAVSKNENVAHIKASRIDEMAKSCKLRNIQLVHSRTILTVMMRMFEAMNAGNESDISAVASRLLEHLPETLEKESKSYKRIIKYLARLAIGKSRIEEYDVTVIGTYTSRSAEFAERKRQVSEACKKKDWEEAKKFCQDILIRRSEIAALWEVPIETVRVHNIKAYQDLLATKADDSQEQSAEDAHVKASRRIFGDAEINISPWQVGKEAQYGEIEPLDEELIHEILTGEAPVHRQEKEIKKVQEELKETPKYENEFEDFKGLLKKEFIKKMQKNLSVEAVCGIMKIPVSTVLVFAQALNPEFNWESLGANFKAVVLDLARNRSDRENSRPTRRLLRLGDSRSQIQSS